MSDAEQKPRTTVFVVDDNPMDQRMAGGFVEQFDASEKAGCQLQKLGLAGRSQSLT